MNEMMVAVATDDGQHFIDRHFGDARFFDVYRMTATDSGSLNALKTVLKTARMFMQMRKKPKEWGDC
jgi:predicted Fe-Mo cluster-binding NifX family protein